MRTSRASVYAAFAWLLAAAYVGCRSGHETEAARAPEAGASAAGARETAAQAPSTSAEAPAFGGAAVPLGKGGGIDFDDLGFAPGIRKVLAPAAATGNLALVDPDTRNVTPIGGFAGSQGSYAGGHGEGTTSADEGRGLLFAIDRTTKQLDVVDPGAKAIVASANLGGSPDYVRWVEATNEIWVTEPGSEQIEVFTLPQGVKPTPVRASTIRVKGGPESLVIDSKRKKAFTHLWGSSSVAIDVTTRALAATWPNGCKGSRGIALDSARGFLFAGCADGKLMVLDVDHDGKRIGVASSGSGVDVIAYNSALAHVYLPGADSATMAFIGISADGIATVLGTVRTAHDAHCVTADDRGHVWVCDPDAGRLLVFDDPYPRSGP